MSLAARNLIRGALVAGLAAMAAVGFSDLLRDEELLGDWWAVLWGGLMVGYFALELRSRSSLTRNTRRALWLGVGCAVVVMVIGLAQLAGLVD